MSNYTKYKYKSLVLYSSIEFLPASFDTLVTFEGFDETNIIEIRLKNFTVPEKDSTGDLKKRVYTFFILNTFL